MTGQEGVPALRATDVGKRYGARWAVRGVSFRCDGGEALAITGANGAGKSTLLAVCAGVLDPDRGDVAIAGESIAGRRAPARRRLGYVPEAADPPPHLTGDEVLSLVAALKGAAPLSDALRDRLGLADLGPVRLGAMSLGQRRRTCLGAALIGDPTVLLLDEPTNGLDTAGVDVLHALLTERRASGAAIVLATHDRAFIDRLQARELSLTGGTGSPT
jgi:ABC-2 type transport system ATP-binding protein